METDRNLLFGVLAIQVNLLTAARFTEACALWATNNGDKSLGEICVEHGWITAGDRDDVERFVNRKLERHQGDPRRALGESCLRETRELIHDLGLSQFEETLSHLPPAVDVKQVETLSVELEHRSHYTLSRLHSKGGIGQVWIARDGVLNRAVALKELRTDRHASLDAHKRFVKEAQITGQLEHPNIVPVYELAGTPDGTSAFYTMRFVDGQTFGNAIHEYHRRLVAGTAEPRELRTLLTAFIGICNAIGFAHARGVLHRDLKPNNVMVGAFGEVIVLDWGLAKIVGQPDEATPAVAISRGAETDETREGLAHGTLPYTSPEQAAGQQALIDSRTDIYGLGAILFAILTDTAPHHGDNTQELIHRITQRPTPHVRDLRPELSRALDAVCAKAMAHKPADRYRTAKELAADVERWLADEPVSVLPEPWSAKAWRWMKKHRAGSQATALAVLAIAIVASVSAVLIERARRREVAAHSRAEKALQAELLAHTHEAEAKTEAVRRFRESQASVDAMLTGVGEVLQYYPAAKAVRESLLKRAAEMYAQFAREHADDWELRAESARAWIRLGDVRVLLGEHEPALEAYREAIPVLDGFDAKRKADVAGDRVRAYTRLGEVLRERGEFPAAAAALQAAELATRDMPLGADKEMLWAVVELQRGRLFAQQEQTSAAIAAYRQAESTFEAILRQEEDAATRQQCLANLALLRGLLAEALLADGDSAEATKLLVEAARTYESLVAVEPDFPPHLDGLATTRIRLANALRTRGDDDAQAEALRKAIEDFATLLKAVPDVPRFRENQAVARTNLGWLLHQSGDNRSAKEQLDAAIGTLNELWNSPDSLPRHLEELAAAATLLGQTLIDLQEDAAAERNLVNAIRVYEEMLLPLQPESSQYHRGLAAAHRVFGRLLHRQGRNDEAEAEYLLAIQQAQQALESVLEPYARDELAAASEQLGELLAESGGESQRQFEYALRVREQLPDDPAYCMKRAKLLLRMGGKSATAAAQLAQELLDDRSDSVAYRTLLGAALVSGEDYENAVAMLTTIDPAKAPANSPHDFWLVLALRGRDAPGDRDAASAALRRAVSQMEKHAPGRPELLRLKRRCEFK